MQTSVIRNYQKGLENVARFIFSKQKNALYGGDIKEALVKYAIENGIITFSEVFDLRNTRYLHHKTNIALRATNKSSAQGLQ